MEIGHFDDEIPEAKRFGERLLKHGLTLEQASVLTLRYVYQDLYKDEPEKAADAFFAAHVHKYRSPGKEAHDHRKQLRQVHQPQGILSERSSKRCRKLL